MTHSFILAIDQGTSSTKSLIFDDAGIAIAKGSEPLHTSYLDNGFVEQDAEEIYQNVLTSVKKCLQQFSEKGFDPNDIAAIGISNQRETFVIWDKNGKPLHPAIVWQCKRSIHVCEDLKQKGLSGTVNAKTGLVIDPYFSATKLIWLNQNNSTIRSAISKGEAFFGTIDTWLLYKLTNGKEYATDFTNASRTLFFNLNTLQWDDELINQFGLTGINLPKLKASSSLFGETTLNNILSKAVPIAALIGDSHAAAFGEGCFEPGTAKATLGTGCSILMNIGSKPIQSNNGMVTTICWSVDGRIDYALEGVIVSCGATIEWLKNELIYSTTAKKLKQWQMQLPITAEYIYSCFQWIGFTTLANGKKGFVIRNKFWHNKKSYCKSSIGINSLPDRGCDCSHGKRCKTFFKRTHGGWWDNF
jgi:glycerol kinase